MLPINHNLSISPALMSANANANDRMQKLALHAGDAFIKGTAVVGIDWLEASNQFLAVLKKIIAENGLSIDLTPFYSAVHWRKIIEDHENLLDAAKSLRNGVEKLKVGEEIWIPSNILESTKDQGLLLGFKRTSNKRYEILTINFGNGIESHPSILINGEKKYQSALVLKSASANRLCQEDFFENLLEAVCFTKWGESANPSLWYQVFLPYLGGTIDRSNQTYETLQRSNSNEVKTLFGLLRYHLRQDLPLYKRIKLLYRQEILHEATEKLGDSPHRSFIHLIRQIIKQQAKSLEKVWKKWALNKEPERVNRLIHELSGFEIKAKEAKKQLSIEEPVAQPRLPSQSVEGIYRDDLFSEQPHHFFKANAQPTLSRHQPFNHQVRNQKEPPYSLNEMAAKDSLPNEIKLWVQTAYRSNTLPSIFDPSWEKIPENQLENWIIGISQVVSGRGVPYFYLLAIVEKLSLRHPLLKEKLKGYTLYSRSQLAYFAFSSNEDSIITSPKEQKKLLELLKFYGLENYDPARDGPEFLRKLDGNVAIDTSIESLWLGQFFNSANQRFLLQFSEFSGIKSVWEFLTGKQTPSPLLEALYGAAFNRCYHNFRGDPHDYKKFGYTSVFHLAGVYWLKNRNGDRFYDNRQNVDYENGKIGIDQNWKKLIFYPQNGLIARQDSISHSQLSCSSYDRIGRAVTHVNHQLNHSQPEKIVRSAYRQDSPASERLIKYFFQGPVLLRTLLNEPRMAIELMQMIHTRLKMNKKNDREWDKELFQNYLMYATLGARLKAQIEYAMQEVPGKYAPFVKELDPLLMPFDQHLRDTIIPDCSNVDRKEVLNLLSKLYPDTLSKDPFATYASDHLLFNLFNISLSDTLASQKEILIRLAEDKDLRNAVLKKVFFYATNIDTGEREWELEAPNFDKAGCGHFTIDFKNATSAWKPCLSAIPSSLYP